MKKLLILVMLGSALLTAGPVEDQEKMKETMQSLELSMSAIQKGFLYNHRGRIQMGIDSLRKELKNINSFVIKNDETIQFNAHEYAKKETKALDLMASRILSDFDAGNKGAVMIEFEQILNRCVTCHALVRKW